MGRRKTLDAQAGDQVSICFFHKNLCYKRREYNFQEWTEYLKRTGLTLMPVKVKGDYDVFTLQRICET